MAPRRYSFHRLAVRELEAERRHYRCEADDELAVRDVTIRSSRVKRFPFRLYFGEVGDHLRVYAVAHVRRRPDYWARRVGR